MTDHRIWHVCRHCQGQIAQRDYDGVIAWYHVSDQQLFCRNSHLTRAVPVEHYETCKHCGRVVQTEKNLFSDSITTDRWVHVDTLEPDCELVAEPKGE